MRKLVIFDIDGVLADSNHRQLTCPKTGNLDLDHWRENSTPEKVMKDKPIDKYISKLHHHCNQITDIVVIMTARVFADVDIQWLQTYLPYDELYQVYSRIEGETAKDADLKAAMLFECLEDLKFDGIDIRQKILYDDNFENIDSLNEFGVLGLHVTDGDK